MGEVGEQAVVLHRGPLTTRQRRWVAVINGWPTATLACLTAAHEWGLAGFETEITHIVVPRGAWVPPSQVGVKVHESRRFDLSHRHPTRTPPIVRMERAILDAAAWTRQPRRACALVIAAVQQRRRDALGRVRYLDVRFRRRDGRYLDVEIDGAGHFDVLAAWSEMDRDIGFLAKGEPTARVPAAILRSDPAGVAGRIRTLLDARW